MKFKKGQIIILKEPYSMVAQKGAKARVTKDCKGNDEYVNVIWIDSKSKSGDVQQHDGAYFSTSFELADAETQRKLR